MSHYSYNGGGQSYSSGIGFFGLLTIVFIVLKLIGVISWPWVWVLAPIWIPIVLTASIFFIILIITLLVTLMRH